MRLIVGESGRFEYIAEILGSARKMDWQASAFIEMLVDTLLSTAKIK